MITGAAGGLGLAIAATFAEEGATVVLTDVDAERVERAAAHLLTAGGSAHSAALDVTDSAAVEVLAACLENEVGAAVPGYGTRGDPNSPGALPSLTGCWQRGTERHTSMKQGKTLVELAQEIERQANARADYAAPAAALELQSNGHTELSVGNLGPFEVGPLAHRQLGAYLGVPAEHYDFLRGNAQTLQAEAPAGRRPLCDIWANTLLQARGEERRLVRTLDGRARAVLSDRYRPIDHDEIAGRILPVLGEIPGIDWSEASFEITETRLYTKVVNARVQADVRVGDPGQQPWQQLRRKRAEIGNQ